jgi:microcystin-dependent protein
MAQWPPTPVSPLPSTGATWPSRTEVGPLTLIGPTAENQQPSALDTRTETLRQITNVLIGLYNFIQDFFLDRDGADLPIADSTQGSYFMRGNMDLGGFKIVNLADAQDIRDAITIQQLEAVQFSAEDDVEQVLDSFVVKQDGSAAMIAPLNMGGFRILNMAAAVIDTDAIRRDTLTAEEATITSAFLRRVGVPGMLANLNFDGDDPLEPGFIPTNLGDPTGPADLVNKRYLDEQVAISAAQDVPVGAVVPYAGPQGTIPVNFLVCDGREVSRFTYQNLFNIIGIAYGSPTSASVFKLPDLRGRTVVGMDIMGGQPADVLTSSFADLLGGKGGVERYALKGGEMPSHTHTYDDVTYAQGAGGAEIGDDNASDNNNVVGISPSVMGSAGSSTPHNNVQPSIALNWLIRY